MLHSSSSANCQLCFFSYKFTFCEATHVRSHCYFPLPFHDPFLDYFSDRVFLELVVTVFQRLGWMQTAENSTSTQEQNAVGIM